MNLVVYTLPYAISNEAEKINKLFDEGLNELHVRKCRTDKNEIEKLLKAIKPKYLDKIVLHMNFSLATKFKLKGIHVSTDFFKGVTGYFRAKALDKSLKVYTSVSSCDDIDELSFPFNHVLLGPLFKRFSAEYSSQNFNEFQLNKTLRKTKHSIFAMGGIDLSNFQQLENYNFDALVVQSSIWKSDDYLNAFNAFAMKKTNTVNTDLTESLELK